MLHAVLAGCEARCFWAIREAIAPGRVWLYVATKAAADSTVPVLHKNGVGLMPPGVKVKGVFKVCALSGWGVSNRRPPK